MSLATTREKRKNAGLKMAKLLDEEEEDDFYKTAYGGFQEVARFSKSLFLNIVPVSSFFVLVTLRLKMTTNLLPKKKISKKTMSIRILTSTRTKTNRLKLRATKKTRRSDACEH